MAYTVIWNNHKGGPGKTRAGVNTAAVLAKKYHKNICWVDFDPQGDLSRSNGFEIEAEEPHDTISDVLLEMTSKRNIPPGGAARIIQKCRWNAEYAERIYFVPSRFDLEDRAIELSSPDSFFRLRHVMEGVDDSFDFLFVDTPPSLGPLTQMAWTLAGGKRRGSLVIVTEPTFPSLRGAARTMNVLYQRREGLQVPDLDVGGVVINKFRETENHRRKRGEITDLFGLDRVLTTVPLRTRISDMDDRNLPVTELRGKEGAEHEEYYEPVAKHLVKLQEEAMAA